MTNHKRPRLEVLSWIAGILSATLSVYVWLRTPNMPEANSTPSGVVKPQSPRATLAPDIRKLFENLDKTTYNGLEFDYWPNGGMRSEYSHVSTYVTYQLLVSAYGQPIFVSGPHTDTALDLNSIRSFGYYDSGFPKWLSKHLAEVLTDHAFVRRTAPLVKKYLLELGFLYFESYQYLNANQKLKQQLIDDYKKELAGSSPKPGYYWWLSWLAGKKEDTDVVWMMTKLDKRYDSNRASSAVYFWIRRSIDGSEADFYEVLLKFLLAYDNAYVSNVLTLTEYTFRPGGG